MSGEVGQPFVGSRIASFSLRINIASCINFVAYLFASFVFVCVCVPSGVMHINVPNNKRHFFIAEEVRD